MVGFGLFIEDLLKERDESVILAGLRQDFEVNLFFKLLGLNDLDDFVLTGDGLLYELESHIKPFLHELALIVGVGTFFHMMSEG